MGKYAWSEDEQGKNRQIVMVMILRMGFWFRAGPTNGTVPAKEKRA